MPVLRVFDPPMCCSTGVCGPSVDPELARFSADLEWLKQQGVEVRRYNLAQEPGAFVEHAPVKAALQSGGNDSLPLVMVDERVATVGTYPSRETLAALAGVVVHKLAVKATGSSCCGPSAAAATSTKKTNCC
jgi:hypothetical protein